jgi:uncharacterized protein
MDRKTQGANPAAKSALPTTSTIAVVGASARAAAMSVLRSGRQAVAADLFADADLRRACPATRISPYPAALANWLCDTSCDGWLYTGALENYPELVDELATLRPLLGNPGSVLRRVRDPLLLQQVLQENGLAFPETHFSCQGLSHDGSWLAKTYRGSSGVGVSELRSATQNRVFYQRRVTGFPCSALFAGRLLLGITRQLVGEAWTGASQFQYCGSLAPWPLTADAENSLRTLGEVLVDEFDLVGLYGVDFIFDGQRPWTIEVNPRYTSAAEVVEQARNACVIDWHVANHLHCVTPPTPVDSWSTCHGKAILFAKLTTTVAEEFTDWALDQADLADIPPPGSTISAGQPLLTVRDEAGSIPLILSALKSRMDQVERLLWGGVGACDWAS